MEFIGCLVLFFLGHIYFEKKGLPRVLDTVKLRFVLLGAVILIATSILLTKIAFLSSSWLVMGTTILSSTIIAYKYRKKFENMERGEEV